MATPAEIDASAKRGATLHPGRGKSKPDNPGILKPFLSFAVSASHDQSLVVVEEQFVIATRGGFPSFDSIKVDDHGTTDAEKHGGWQFRFEVGQSVTKDMVAAGCVEHGIIGGRFDVINMLEFDQEGLVARFDWNAVGNGRLAGGTLKQIPKVSIGGGSPPRLDLLTGTADGLLEPMPGERFDKVIDCMDLESLQGMLIMSRDENHPRHL